MMKKKQIKVSARAADSFPATETRESNSLLSRREMLGIAGMAGLVDLTGTAPNAVAQNAPKRPRIACLVSYWGLPTSHADWIINKLLDGYWWKGAHTPSRVDVVSVYVHQLETSLLAQKVCKAKNIPIYKTAGAAVTLGGNERRRTQMATWRGSSPNECGHRELEFFFVEDQASWLNPQPRKTHGSAGVGYAERVWSTGDYIIFLASGHQGPLETSLTKLP
jgi:hypothetical protein